MENKTSYTKPELRERIKDRLIDSDRGGKPGQWSARKSQLLAKEYEDAGGGYKGGKTESQKSLSRWSSEKWMIDFLTALKDGDSMETMEWFKR